MAEPPNLEGTRKLIGPEPSITVHFSCGSGSMGDHDLGVMDGRSIDRGDAGTLGVVAAGCEGAGAWPVHAGARCGVSGAFFSMVCQARSDGRRAGCGRRRRAIPALGGNRHSGARSVDADDLRDIVRDYALETLADDDAVLVIDETGFLKQGKASCGGGRQYTDRQARSRWQGSRRRRS